MKEKYIEPQMKWVDLYQESLMKQISVKIVDDEEEYDEAANEGIFDDSNYQLKNKIWDE